MIKFSDLTKKSTLVDNDYVPIIDSEESEASGQNKSATIAAINAFIRTKLPSWALAATKPSYTAEEIGALPATTTAEDIGAASKSDVEDLEDTFSHVYPTDTADGNPATFTDGADGMYIKSIVATLEPNQDLHGYDSPFPGGITKNLLKLLAPQTITRNGVTITINGDGTVTVNGTASSYTEIAIANNVTVPIGSLVFSGCPNGGSSTAYSLRWSSSMREIDEYGSGESVTTTTEESVTVSIYIANGTTLNNAVFSPMIRENGASADFEPYENICPIEGYDSVAFNASLQAVRVELPSTTYGGVLDSENGNLTVTHKLVAMESVNWSRTALSAGFGIYTTSGALIGKGMDDTKVISSMFASSPSSDALGSTPDASIRGRATSYNQIVVRYDAVETVEDFVAAVTGQTMCFKLETPVVIPMGSGIPLKTVYGNNTVSMDAKGTILVKYCADVGLYIDKKLGG